MKPKIGREMDETCGRDGCDGLMGPNTSPPEGCHCHTSPPCELCVNAPCECDKCGESADDFWRDEEDAEQER